MRVQRRKRQDVVRSARINAKSRLASAETPHGVSAPRSGERRPTMADVARLAGVSQSIVSLVLNQIPGARISSATREKVFAAAWEVNYDLPGVRRHERAVVAPDVVEERSNVRRRRGDTLAVAARRATMMEVAHEAGVSQTTVSFVLNEVIGARLSAETRKRVFEAAARVNYQVTRRRGVGPMAAQGAIAFVIDEMSTDPWMALALDGIREKASERGVMVHTIVTGGNAEIAQATLNGLSPGHYLGLIFGAINLRRIETMTFPLGLPTVLFNCYVADHSLTSVVPAEVLGGHAATQRLIAAGHTRIGYINGESWMDASRDRLKGYRRALAEADIAFDRDLIFNGNWEPSAGFDGTQALMALEPRPTAIFCANDLMAFGCYEKLRELGLAIPLDVAVIGYDDRDIATFMHPPLTTFLLPLSEMGAEAALCLFDAIGRAPSRSSQIKVEGELIERCSI